MFNLKNGEILSFDIDIFFAKNKEKADETGDQQYTQYYQTKGDYRKEPVVVKTEPKVVNNYNGAINLPNVQNPTDFQTELANRAGRK